MGTSALNSNSARSERAGPGDGGAGDGTPKSKKTARSDVVEIARESGGGERGRERRMARAARRREQGQGAEEKGEQEQGAGKQTRADTG